VAHITTASKFVVAATVQNIEKLAPCDSGGAKSQLNEGPTWYYRIAQETRSTTSSGGLHGCLMKKTSRSSPLNPNSPLDHSRDRKVSPSSRHLRRKILVFLKLLAESRKLSCRKYEITG
jgi:hypothetical protein